MKRKTPHGLSDAEFESLQRKVQDEIAAFRGSDRLDRDLVHDRAIRSQR